ncbi:HMG domain-containing protein 3 [Desmophyllum pertusum]|uniref:HMG domain-containing protein 3 n=1 Tax=Desmophyllum pertusum TaxID=174260 RepID=A0A9W9YRP4_9CNID|nr:HMG domain-containing protein 3 [Desmophyllum pertusum]
MLATPSTKRGFGSCAGCGQSYSTRWKPVTCSNCGGHIGGNREEVLVLETGNEKILSVQTSTRDDRCFVVREGNTALCTHKDCLVVRVSYVSSGLSCDFKCKHVESSQDAVIPNATTEIALQKRCSDRCWTELGEAVKHPGTDGEAVLITSTFPFRKIAVHVKICKKQTARHQMHQAFPSDIGLFNVGDHLLVSFDILLEWREHFKFGHPISNVITAKLASLNLKLNESDRLPHAKLVYLGKRLYHGFYCFEAITDRSIDDVICGACGIVDVYNNVYKLQVTNLNNCIFINCTFSIYISKSSSSFKIAYKLKANKYQRCLDTFRLNKLVSYIYTKYSDKKKRVRTFLF